MCSHELPDGPPPSCSGLELPPNEFCLWPRLPVSGSSFMQPPPVRRQIPGCSQLIGVVTESSARTPEPPEQSPVATAVLVQLREMLQSTTSCVFTRASNVTV